MAENTIEGLTSLTGSIVYQDANLRNTLEYFVPYLRTHSTTRPITVDRVLLERYQFDFIGLMQHLGVIEDLHWINLRVGGLNSPTDLSVDHTSLYLVDADTFNRLVNTYRANKK